MRMKSDASNFFGRILGNVVIFFGVVIGIALAIFANPFFGIWFLLVAVVWGKFLVFKADRRKGHVLYTGGGI